MRVLWIILLFFNIIAILNCVKSNKPDTHKAMWIILILFVPVLGLMAYLILGQTRRNF